MSMSEVSFCQSALALANRGFRVFPLRPKSKKPMIPEWQMRATTDSEQIKVWWRQWPYANVGVATGKKSNLIVLDVDIDVEKRLDGKATLVVLEEVNGPLPHTNEVITGRGGRHLYFQYPQGHEVRNSAGRLGLGLDARGEGGYVVAPPSIHPENSRIYQWLVDHHPDEMFCAKMPTWLLDKLTEQKGPSSFAEVSGSTPNGKIPVGKRNSYLASLAGSMRARGMSQAAIEAALLVENQECTQPLAESEVKAVARSISQYDPGRSKDDPGLIKEMADRILTDHSFAKDPGGMLYHFEAGCYRPTGEEFIFVQFQILLEAERMTKLWSTHRSRELAAYIATQSVRLWDKPPLDRLNLANGIYHILDRQLLPHDPSYLSSLQLSVSYDPKATCPNWETFLDDVLSKDTHQLFAEIVAYIMTPDMSQQKAFLLYGEGSNGKSTIIKGLENFLGPENICTLSLQKLETNRFAAARLVGKLVNMFADLPAEHLDTSSTFKAISGGDRLTAERKFQDSFDFQPICRLVFSANHYPVCRDASPAFFRRWVVLPFERTFSDDDAQRIDPKIMEGRLGSPVEKSGLLNLALQALPTFRDRSRFLESQTTDTAWMEFRDQTDPIAQWLDLYTIFNAKAFVTRKDLSIRVNAWLRERDMMEIDNKTIFSAIRRLRPTAKEKQQVINGQNERGFLGLRFKYEAGN